MAPALPSLLTSELSPPTWAGSWPPFSALAKAGPPSTFPSASWPVHSEVMTSSSGLPGAGLLPPLPPVPHLASPVRDVPSCPCMGGPLLPLPSMPQVAVSSCVRPPLPSSLPPCADNVNGLPTLWERAFAVRPESHPSFWGAVGGGFIHAVGVGESAQADASEHDLISRKELLKNCHDDIQMEGAKAFPCIYSCS